MVHVVIHVGMRGIFSHEKHLFRMGVNFEHGFNTNTENIALKNYMTFIPKRPTSIACSKKLRQSIQCTYGKCSTCYDEVLIQKCLGKD